MSMQRDRISKYEDGDRILPHHTLSNSFKHLQKCGVDCKPGVKAHPPAAPAKLLLDQFLAKGRCAMPTWDPTRP